MWDIHGNCVRKKRVICALKYLFVKNEINNSSYHWFRMLKLDYVFHASKLQTSCFYFHHFHLLTRARSHFIIKPLTIILLLLWYVKIFTYCKILQYYPCNKQKTINARKNTKMRANQDFSQFHARFWISEDSLTPDKELCMSNYRFLGSRNSNMPSK